jgi:tRNA 2-thiouridine synthesizing protein A|tara:strand:+ start:92 stop:367 length:276 start_codon:yes stop_codon:yes gene_type:complete
MTKDPNKLSTQDSETLVSEDLDATGLYCPEPVMLLHNKIRDIAAGELLRLIATDPSTTRDIPKFCAYLGHELVKESKRGDTYYYLIRKSLE